MVKKEIMTIRRNSLSFSQMSLAALVLALASLTAVPCLRAQAGKSDSKAEHDVLIFTDGEKLIGHLVRSTGGSVTFKSDMAGEISVDWSKIQELHTTQPYAVVQKNVKLHKHEDAGKIPQGTIAMTDQKIAVSAGPERAPLTVAVGDAAYVIDEPAFQKAVLHHPSIFEDWKGAVTAGASLVEATQSSRTFTGSVSLIRAIPAENWLDARNRTTADFTASYGKLTQPNSPTLRTGIYHADAERDQYFTQRVYAFGQLAYDHNISQGLDLQQAYGGGLGWTVIKRSNQTLDVKGSLSYVDQQFQTSALNQKLIGSTFSERYNRTFSRGILFTEQLSINPAWNNTRAYSAAGSAGITMPLYKRFSFTLGALDTLLNNPPPGFKKNSFQFTMGLTYTLP
jgi:hypothetical protein